MFRHAPTIARHHRVSLIRAKVLVLIDPNAYNTAFAPILAEERLPELGPGTPDETKRAYLAELSDEGAFPGLVVVDPDMARCCIAAAWLYGDFIDEAHRIVQKIDTRSGAFWHGIVHRREPDPANAKYWFRRVGAHPIYDDLRTLAAQLAVARNADERARYLLTQEAWDSFAFVDLCEDVTAGRSDARGLCREIQQREWELLFDYCYRYALTATGGHDA